MLQLDNFIRLRADLRVVSDKEESVPSSVKVMKDFHDGLFVFRIQVPRGLVSQNDLGLVN